MGFIKEKYLNNQGGLTVSFQGEGNTESYFAGDSASAALEYFNMYLKDNQIYIRTDEEIALDEVGIKSVQEATELRQEINSITSTMTDEEAAERTILFKEWQSGVAYSVGERVRYNDGLFKVLQAHTSQDNWIPTLAHSLFAVILNPDPSIIPEWIQPDSTNGYSRGDKVYHNNILWTSTADNNVWEPGAVGAPWTSGEEEETPTEEPSSEIPEWSQPDSTNPYNTGDQVMYNGSVYESTINNNVWAPDVYGWQLIE